MTKHKWPLSTHDNLVPIETNCGLEAYVFHASNRKLNGMVKSKEFVLTGEYTPYEWTLTGEAQMCMGVEYNLIPPKPEPVKWHVVWDIEQGSYPNPWLAQSLRDAESVVKTYGGRIVEFRVPRPEEVPYE